MADEKKYVVEVNCETGEETTREFTADEYAAAEASRIAFEEQQAAAEAEAQAKAAAKQSAQDKLKALGLSDTEIVAITGA